MLLVPSPDCLLRGCGLLLSFFALTACALAQPAPGERPGAPPSSVKTSYREMPVQLCVPVQAEDWTALRSGGARLLLHLQNQIPTYLYSPSFQVSLVGKKKPQRVAVDQLSMHPDIVGTSGLPDPQHFAIDLRAHLPAASESTLCVEVGVEAGDKGAAPEEKADHPIRIWATLETRRGH